MKTIVSCVSVFFLTVMLACCSDGKEELAAVMSEPELNTKIGGSMTIQASTSDANIRKNPETFAEVLWAEGDKLLVGGQEFTLVEGAGTTDGVFEGPQLGDGSYEAYYNTTWRSLPSRREGTEGRIVSPMYTEVTVTDGCALKTYLTNLCGFLALKVNSEEAVKLKFVTVSSNQDMAGDFRFSADDTPVLEKNLRNTITLDCESSGAQLSSEGSVFYFALPAGSYNDIRLEMIDLNGNVCSKKLTSSQGISISRARLTEMEWDDVSFTSRGCADLGLSVKWATCNIGAWSPEESGNYFAWGETEPKEFYNTDTYFDAHYTKYSKSTKQVLSLEDDAAYINWWGDWRMPTKSEIEEIQNCCYWVWTDDYNNTGVSGYVIFKAKEEADKGKVTGENSSYSPVGTYSVSGNDVHIFLPESDVPVYESDISGDNFGYWSSSLFEAYESLSWFLYFKKDTVSPYIFLRVMGLPVRAVRP